MEENAFNSKELVAHLKKIRLEKGLEIKDVAKRCELAETNIRHVEAGNNIKPESIAEYAKSLGFTVEIIPTKYLLTPIQQ